MQILKKASIVFLVFLLTTLRNLLKIQEKSTALLCIPPDALLANCVISWTNHWPEDPSSQTLPPPPAMTCPSPNLSLWSLHPAPCALVKLQAGKVPLFGAVWK